MAAHARVAELVDAHDSKSCSARSGGSIPSTGTSLRSRSGAKAARRSLGEGGRCKPPRATTGKPAVQFSTKQGGSVGWVERSETHRRGDGFHFVLPILRACRNNRGQSNKLFISPFCSKESAQNLPYENRSRPQALLLGERGQSACDRVSTKPF